MSGKDKLLYRIFLNLDLPRESALNLILVRKGLKDATTINFTPDIARQLKKSGYIYEIDESYLKERVHGFLEHTTKVPLFDAPLIKRLYVGRKIARSKLRHLRSGSNFDQGITFGFPICDTLNYCQKSKKEGKSYIEIFKDWLSAIPSTNGLKPVDFRFLGGLIKYYQDIRIIVHIPHRYDCKESLELAQRNLSLLKELDKRFHEFLVYEFTRPLLIYGNKWESFQMLQFDKINKSGKNKYIGKCLKALGLKIPKNSVLEIKLTPHKKVEVFLKNIRIDANASSKSVPWSYNFIVPFDSLSKTGLERSI